MKSAEGNGGQSSRQTKEVNIKDIATQILKTMALLQKPFGQAYLCQILEGEFKWDPKHPSHLELETFGAAYGQKTDRLNCIFQLLLDKGYVKSDPPNFNTIALTDVGERYLNKPQDWTVSSKALSYRKSDLFLRQSLRTHRSLVSQLQGMETWLVFSNFTLEALVRMKPNDYQSLSKVPGMSNIKCEHFGAGILAVFQESKERFEAFVLQSNLEKIKRGSYPAVQKLFNDNASMEDIAGILGIKLTTVANYLRELHVLGKVNLIPWIEKSIDSKKLFKAAEYFRNVQDPSLKEAYSALGLDYEVLLFSKLYVADFKRQEAELALTA